MNAITKNKLSEAQLKQIVTHAFQGRERLNGFREFTEGYCNASYRLDLSSGKSVVLKVSAPPDIERMACETALMETEVNAMHAAREHGLREVPQVYAYDISKTLCSGDYFLMSLMHGQSYDQVKPSLSDAERDQMDVQIGRWLHALNETSGTRFGHFLRSDLQYDRWYDAFVAMMKALLQDGERKRVDITLSSEALFHRLERDKPCFQEVVTPRLTHFDSWDGNVFVQNGELIGLIDWERAMWADALMEYGFRSHSVSAGFLRGYGKPQLTQNERIRSLWYDVYLYLIMMIEGAYRHYEDDGQYRWAKGWLLKAWEGLS